MKSLTWLLECMLEDTSIRCGTDTHLDIRTIKRRIDHEGVSFLTITLPTFAQDLERGLEQKFVDSTLFLPFKKRGCLPVFLRGFTSLVFDPGDGTLLPNPNEDAIFCIRQICLMFKKVNLPCSEKRVKDTLNGFKQLESELTGAMSLVPDMVWDDFGLLSDVLWSETFGSLSSKIENLSIIPRHGPGATAEKISGNSKYRHLTWHNRLQTYFPFDYFGHSTQDSEYGSIPESVKFRDPDAELPVRVITVPKTLKSPRVIAIEPVCMQYIQQGLLSEIVSDLENGPYTSGQINFSDQSINGELALQSSRDGLLATIDLSEASDRVHKDLVYHMFRSTPVLRDAIFACRSMRANLPDGTIVPLNKFASMGSALCFPVESMAFYTLCLLGRFYSANVRPTPQNIKHNIKRLCSGVYVYGDDLIVPADEVPVIIDVLESVKLKVNARKSFWNGSFRESCGVDAYNGIDVTPVYVRSMPPRDKQDASGIVSFVSLANQLYKAGWWRSAQTVRDYVESLLRIQLPHVLDTASCMGWYSFTKSYSVHRYSQDYQAPEVKSMVVRVSDQQDPLEGYAALMKFFLKRGTKPIFGKHLERSVRPGSVNIKYRWARPC
jgi:hypothetical protein